MDRLKRSNKPIFWSLFGAGGMLSALAGPGLVWITGIAAPLGIVDLHFERASALAHDGFGKLAIFFVISLFLFHGFAALGSVAAAVLLVF